MSDGTGLNLLRLEGREGESVIVESSTGPTQMSNQYEVYVDDDGIVRRDDVTGAAFNASVYEVRD